MLRNNSDVRAPAPEKGEVLQVFAQRCWNMKRQKPCTRLATGLLLLTIFSMFFLLQVSAQDADREQEEKTVDQTRKNASSRRSKVFSIQLLCNGTDHTALMNGTNVIRWFSQQHSSKLRLQDDNTGLVVPTNGWYLVNLRLSYRVPGEGCPLTDDHQKPEDRKAYLLVSIMQKSSGYPKWFPVAVGQETMACKDGSQQAITLVRVIKLEKSNVLRVTIASANLQLVSWSTNDYFEVVRL